MSDEGGPHDPLPPELEGLERALARRPLPAPHPGLRARALGEIRRARTREQRLLLAAAAAIVLVVGGLRASMPPVPDEPRGDVGGVARMDEELLEHLGFDAAGARREALLMHVARVPRIAPPLGSGALPPRLAGGE